MQFDMQNVLHASLICVYVKIEHNLLLVNYRSFGLIECCKWDSYISDCYLRYTPRTAISTVKRAGIWAP